MLTESVTGLYKLAKHLERVGIFNELLLISNESLIPNGRDTIANIFMNDTNHTHLLMLDADVGFTPEDVIKLFELEVDFAVGAYPMKVIPLAYNFITTTKEKSKDGKALSIDTIGAGFCLVTRKVFTDVALDNEDLKFIPADKALGYSISEKRLNNSYAYFETYIDKKNMRKVSEDFAFNNRWRATGGKIWLETSIQLTHSGTHVFRGVDLTKFS